MAPRLVRSYALLALASLPFVACGSTPDAAGQTARAEESVVVAPRAWPHEDSDIPVDPRIHFGRLDNGLRYAWAAHPEPEERVYLRLHVDVGSLAEEDDQLGMAHFLEHMAFNGSRNFPAGTLIEWFQEHGMAFGADTNAHTGFSETVYKLDLPEADAETLREGLLVMRDFADGLLLEDDEVEAEKGVIDGEQRERDSPQMRVLQQQLELMFAGTRLEDRLPIGKAEVRAAFDGEAVRAFYEHWYRPDNMTLVLVGDIDELDPEPLFEEYFGDMRAPRTPLPAEPDVGRAQRYDHAYLIREEEIPRVQITLERLVPWEEEPLTVAAWLEDLPLEYARSMLNLRFRELAKEEDAPFLGAGASSAELFEVYDGESLGLSCDPGRWREALAFCEQELRRALEGGFQEAELAELRADALRALDEGVEREATLNSTALLGSILAAAEDPVVPMDAKTRRALVRPALEALSVADCDAAFRAAWSEGDLALYAIGNLELGADPGAELLAAYDASAEEPVEARAAIETAAFAYASDPDERGEIASREDIEDLGFTLLTFANGVTVSVKRTDFKENQVLVGGVLGEGGLTLAPPRPELQWVAGQALNGIGLVAHSEDDLRRLTAGKQVGVGLSVEDDAFTLGGATTAEDLLLQCELTCAYLQAPGWRPDLLVQLRRQLPLFYEGLTHQHQGPMLLEFLPALFSGDLRFALPTEESTSSVKMDEIESWVAQHYANAPLEVQIVGDLDVEATIDIAARTFGMLPERRDWKAFDERRAAPAPATGVSQTHAIATEVPKSMVMIVFPIPDALEPDVARSFNMLNTVVNDRLRLEVRERLGAAYSPGAGVEQSRVFPGVGMLMIQAMSDPDKVETLVEACLGVADSLSTDGVTPEELERLRAPLLKQRRDAKRTNGYWMQALSRARRDPQHLERVRTADAFYESVQADRLSPLAAEYLTRERASVLVVHPDE